MLSKKSKIYVAGHNGMVGSAIIRELNNKKFKNVHTRSRKQLNLLDQYKTFKFLNELKPDVVIICAAKVGGINANNLYRAEFIYENNQIQNNLIHGSYISKVKKLIFLGSSCIYPKNCKQPMKEEYLLSGKLEYSNEPYAISKINGIKMCENYNLQFKTNYISLMPCNLYGQNDNYNLENSHFLPALISKIHDAKIYKKKHIELWGNGKAKREIMHVDDLASACIYFLNKKIKHNLINIGSNKEYSIKEYANMLMEEIGYKAKIRYNNDMPNGTPRKLLDSSLARAYGWKPKIGFKKGISNVYNDFILQNDH